MGSLAVMLAGGGELVSDLDVLRTGAGMLRKHRVERDNLEVLWADRDQPGIFSYGFTTLTRELRSRAWEAAGDLTRTGPPQH